LSPIHGDATQKRKVISDQGIVEELFLGHKVKKRFERKADNGNIGPVLMFGKDDDRPMISKSLLPLDFNPIKNGQNQSRYPSC
jgi:hypothetical protein